MPGKPETIEGPRRLSCAGHRTMNGPVVVFAGQAAIHRRNGCVEFGAAVVLPIALFPPHRTWPLLRTTGLIFDEGERKKGDVPL